jgi:hypothetical protein
MRRQILRRPSAEEFSPSRIVNSYCESSVIRTNGSAIYSSKQQGCPPAHVYARCLAERF